MHIFLHQDDLRRHDNKGLAGATSDGDTIPIYIDDPTIIDQTGRNKRAFRLNALHSLNDTYNEHNAQLHYYHGRTETILADLINDHDITAIHYNKGYRPTRRRIQQRIDELPVQTTPYKDRVSVEPDEPPAEYDTFSPFYQAWKQRHNPRPVTPALTELEELPSQPLPSPEDVQADLPSADETTALQRWADFRDNRMSTYKDKRDNVANPDAVSRLSPYYASGILSVRTVLHDVEQRIEQADDSSTITNYAKYRSELAWREFFIHVLYHNPSAVNDAYKDIGEIDWANNDDEITAWKHGKTGVPFVDAGIRELRQTGYMHNRLRQNVASFLTKHLMTDWRIGADFFAEHLIDHDVANNNGGWQWAASTGTDSVPIRIFNPVKQGKQYDENATYIKRWIPELRGLDPATIHDWVRMTPDERQTHDTAYPSPIINFDERYHQGKAMFQDALNN